MTDRRQAAKDVFRAASQAMTPPDLVRVSREGIDPPGEFTRGFVVGASPELILLHLLSDRVDLDGYAAFRTADISSLDRDFPRRPFYLRALELKGPKPRTVEAIDLSDVRSLLRSIEKQFPLVVIERELVSPGECEIGRIKLTTETTYALKCIGLDATWLRDSQSYKYSDITRIGFDGEYERTLALVAAAIGTFDQ